MLNFRLRFETVDSLILMVTGSYSACLSTSRQFGNPMAWIKENFLPSRDTFTYLKTVNLAMVEESGNVKQANLTRGISAVL